METNNKELYYTSLSKFRLVQMMKERGDFKYLHSMTKPEIIKKMCEMDMRKDVGCKCKCKKFMCEETQSL